jgi:hypothetical protein
METWNRANWNSWKTEYPKIETLFERNLDVPKTDPRYHKLKEPLVFKNPVYGIINKWRWTEKINGTNIRITWIPEGNYINYGCVDSDAAALFWPAQLRYQGRTDKAILPHNLQVALEKLFPVEKMKEVFPDRLVILYGEGYDAGIQKGGGKYRPDQSFILFDVCIPDLNLSGGVFGPAHQTYYGKWWLSDTNVQGIAATLGIDVVPFVGEYTIMEAVGMVLRGFKSAIGEADAEGLVGRPVETIYDKRGGRFITKLKTEDFYKVPCSLCQTICAENVKLEIL